MTESALGWISPRSAKKWGPPDVASSQVGTQRLRHWFNQAVLLYPLPFSAVPRRVIGLLLLLVGGQTEPTVANWHGSLRVNQRNGLVGGDAILFCHLALNWCVGGGFEQSFFFFLLLGRLWGRRFGLGTVRKRKSNVLQSTSTLLFVTNEIIACHSKEVIFSKNTM